MVLFLKILGALAALALGIYLGWGGPYRPDPELIERALDGHGQRRKVRRHFTPLGWLRGRLERASRERRRSRGGRSGPFALS